MKSAYFLIPLVLLLSDVFSQGYQINGKINNCDNKWVFLTEGGSRGAKLDSIKCTDNKVRFTGKDIEPKLIEMKVQDDKSSATFWLENKDFGFVTYQDSLWKIKLTGSPLNKLFYEFEENVHLPIVLQYVENNRKSAQVVLPRDSVQLKALNRELDSLQGVANSQMTDFIIKNKDSFLSLNFLSSHYNTFGLSRSIAFIDSMDEELRNTLTAQRLLAVMRKIASLKVNDSAPNFSLKDIDGKVVSLSSFRGKKVLINFWASWCGPCRKEHPDLIRLSEKYQSKNVAFISISTDKNSKNWKEAVKKDRLTWLQLLDEEDSKGISTSNNYGVSGIPQTMLIDENGKVVIISDNLVDIEAFLAKVFVKKP